MRIIYLCWIDDVKGFVASYDGIKDLLEIDHNVEFIIDEHNNTENIETIARSLDDNIIFLIDYNLKGSDGKGIDGDSVIKLIREHNEKCKIVFYSSKATQSELISLVGHLTNIRFSLRETLKEVLIDIAKGRF